jgi:hypothetical protein
LEEQKKERKKEKNTNSSQKELSTYGLTLLCLQQASYKGLAKYTQKSQANINRFILAYEKPTSPKLHWLDR